MFIHIQYILIIVCKGTKKNGKFHHCSFLYVGNWGDDALKQHEALHTSADKLDFWLGFDTTQFIGKYSGRDGKRD